MIIRQCFHFFDKPSIIYTIVSSEHHLMFFFSPPLRADICLIQYNVNIIHLSQCCVSRDGGTEILVQPINCNSKRSPRSRSFTAEFNPKHRSEIILFYPWRWVVKTKCKQNMKNSGNLTEFFSFFYVKIPYCLMRTKRNEVFLYDFN